jgi:putative transposase
MKNNKKQLLNTAYNKAFKFRFYPDSEQRLMLEHYFGCTRFVYNKTLDYSIKHYASRETKINHDYGDLIIIKNEDFKSLSSTNRINYIQELKIIYPWLKEVSSIALQQSIINLNNAYNNFFKRINNKKDNKGKLGFPKFKKKHNRNSFKIVGKNSIHFDKTGSFTLPKFKKSLDIKFSRDFDRDKVSSVTIIKEPNGHYYIVFLSEDNYKRLPSINAKLAFDSGIKTNLTTFNGEINHDKKEVFNTFNLPSLDKLLNRIKLIQKLLSRKVKGSNNKNKTRVKLARLYAKKENIVNDFYYKLSSKIVNDNQVIVAEDLNFISMKENKSKELKNVSKSLQEISLSKIYQYIEYKAKWYGKIFIKADRYYPSSKLCSTPHCEYINHELTLSERTWKCPQYNKVHDRDKNAALVLSYYKEKNKSNSILKDSKSSKIELSKNLNFKV